MDVLDRDLELGGLGNNTDADDDDEDEGRERDTGDSRVGEGLEVNMLLVLLKVDAESRVERVKGWEASSFSSVILS